MIEPGIIRKPAMRVLLNFLILIAILILSNCTKDYFDFDKISTQIKINPAVTSALAYGSLTLADIIREDDSLIFYNDENTIHLRIKEDSAFFIHVSEILQIPDQDSILSFFELQPALINDFTINTIIPLDSLILFMDESLAALIYSLDGQQNYFPPFSQQNLGEYTFDLIEDVDYVEFAGGEIMVTLLNKLPVALQQIDVTLINDLDNSLIGDFTFSGIEPDSSATLIFNLAGVLVRSQVEAKVNHLEVAGSFPGIVEINLSDYLELSVVSDSAKVLKGRAIIPDQVIHQQSKMVNLFFPENEDIQMTYLHLEAAKIEYSIQLYTNESFSIFSKFPKTTRNNQVVEFQLITTGMGGFMQGWWNFDNTITDLTSDSVQHYNKFPVEYEISFISAGTMIDFDLSEHYDRTIDIKITNLGFEEVKGYLGQKTVEFDNEIIELSSELLEKITGISELSNPEMKFSYEHTLGLPVDISFNLKGITNNQEVTLDYPDIFISGAGFAGDVVFNTIVLNNSNSNIVDFVSLRPTHIFISGEATSNPEGKGAVPNFLYSGSYFRAGVEFDVPLSLQYLDITLLDSLVVNFNNDFYKNIDSLILFLNSQNGFPLNAIIDIIFYDSASKTIITTFEGAASSAAAPVNSEGIVIPGDFTQSEDEIFIPPDVINQLPRVDRLIIKAKFSISETEGTPVTLLTSYSLDFSIASKIHFNL